ncbi:hypothetical protein [uncultured Nevskia sp.]|uniref:hypothetical protein n=1 Tax=uncultured Nevskia sp. TaxID=228950 RepID=UPI0025E9C0D8|nr:hypothetical protein [uncultured Nevskia sp.]
MPLKSTFLGELQRRNVHRAAMFYAAAAWLLVQIATQVFPFFDIPNSTVRIVVIAVVIGFPFAMLFSWFYEWTPQGIKRESEIVHSDSITRETGKKLDKKLDRAIIAVLSVAVVLLLANSFAPHKDASSLAAAPAAASTSLAVSKSIAVLPFTDLSPGKDQEYFSDGMAEELLNALAKVKDLKVAGRTSSFSFKGKNEDLRGIGKALGVTTILEGSVRKQGDKVRITAQLIQTDDGFHLWSESYDGDLKDVFELQERIARAITDALKIVLVGEQQQRLVPVATSDPEAYALFLKATKVFNLRDGAHFPEAIAGLNEAIRLDPKYARAYARLAALHAIAINYTAMEVDDAWATAERNARMAIELDPSLAEPHAALGQVYNQQRRMLAARTSLEHAVALDPTDVTAQFWLGTVLIATGYTAQGTAQLDRTLAIDPLLPNALGWRGDEYLNVGDRDNARRVLQQSADAGLSFGEQRLSWLAHAESRDADAIAYSTRGMRIFLGGFPGDASEILARGLFGEAAERAKAVAMIDTYLAAKSGTLAGAAPYGLLLLGEPARALSIAQRAPTNNDALFLQMLWSPQGSVARKLPQFPEFVRKVGLSELWDQYGPPDRCQRKAPGDYVCD